MMVYSPTADYDQRLLSALHLQGQTGTSTSNLRCLQVRPTLTIDHIMFIYGRAASSAHHLNAWVGRKAFVTRAEGGRSLEAETKHAVSRLRHEDCCSFGLQVLQYNQQWRIAPAVPAGTGQ